MKQIKFNTLRCSVLLLFAAFTLNISAQAQQQKIKPYSLNRNKVYYQRQPIIDADYRSFVDLGFGYAKDRYNVYYLGRILPYVDPMTFSLRVAMPTYPGDYPMDEDMYGPDDYYGYRITSNAVLSKKFQRPWLGLRQRQFQRVLYGTKDGRRLLNHLQSARRRLCRRHVQHIL